MGVTYKLRDEVVRFIISQRQTNPAFSCRQLAESAAQQFNIRLSKSSVHDVLKETGIITPRGRKPKDKFQIPSEKKKQIQVSLSKILLIGPPAATDPAIDLAKAPPLERQSEPAPQEAEAASSWGGDIYEGAGKIFLKATLWDLGISSDININEIDWTYYLTYTKGIKVILEGNRSYLIEMILPLHRAIREATDGLVNNIKPLIVHKVSDETLFKSSMEAQPGFKILNILIVDYNNHILCEFCDIMEHNRHYSIINRLFMENINKNNFERSISLFFTQVFDNNEVINNILNLKGYDSIENDEYFVNLLIDGSYVNKSILEQAAERLNDMYLRDEQNRLVKVKIRTPFNQAA